MNTRRIKSSDLTEDSCANSGGVLNFKTVVKLIGFVFGGQRNTKENSFIISANYKNWTSKKVSFAVFLVANVLANTSPINSALFISYSGIFFKGTVIFSLFSIL